MPRQAIRVSESRCGLAGVQGSLRAGGCHARASAEDRTLLPSIAALDKDLCHSAQPDAGGLAMDLDLFSQQDPRHLRRRAGAWPQPIRWRPPFSPRKQTLWTVMRNRHWISPRPDWSCTSRLPARPPRSAAYLTGVLVLKSSDGSIQALAVNAPPSSVTGRDHRLGDTKRRGGRPADITLLVADFVGLCRRPDPERDALCVPILAMKALALCQA